jgi:leucyl-tRNA synthetase
LFESLGLGEGSIHFSSWPTHEEKYLVKNEVIIPIQINGKRRGEIIAQSTELNPLAGGESVFEDKAREIVKTYLEGKEIKKVIYVPGKIINFVI